MEKITITRIHKSDKKKDGTPYVSKEGRPYTRLGIQTREYGDKWLSGFGSGWNGDWKEGSEVEVEIEKVTKDGVEYLNFSKPDPLNEFLTQLNSAFARISELEAWRKTIDAEKPINANGSFSEHEVIPVIKDTDLPF